MTHHLKERMQFILSGLVLAQRIGTIIYNESFDLSILSVWLKQDYYAIYRHFGSKRGNSLLLEHYLLPIGPLWQVEAAFQTGPTVPY